MMYDVPISATPHLKEWNNITLFIFGSLTVLKCLLSAKNEMLYSLVKGPSSQGHVHSGNMSSAPTLPDSVSPEHYLYF